MRLNEHFKNLGESYLFVTIAKKVAAYQKEHPEAKIIRLGIGDVTRPLAPAVIDALHKAVEDQARQETFHGYSPDSDGYPFLREAIAGYYKNFGVELDPSEIFVGDGAKSDLGNMLDLFDRDNTVLIPDPVYPVYVDTNVMDGRPIVYLDATEENGFLPLPDPGRRADLIYLCSPNNPTGAAYNKEQLQAWVDYALEQKAVLLYDAAYEAFITEPGLPHSIFEIPGAKQCAMEFCSLSKTAGFTGMRCGYTVLPRELRFGGVSLGKLWQRRQGCKFNGVSYLTQRGAQAVRGPAPDQRGHRLLPGKRPGDDGGPGPAGHPLHRRGQLPLPVAQVPGGPGQLGLFRLPLGAGPDCGHPGGGLWQKRGGVV